MSDARRLDDIDRFGPDFEADTAEISDDTAEAVGHLALVVDSEPEPSQLSELPQDHPVLEIVVPKVKKPRKTARSSEGSETSLRGELDITRLFLADVRKFPLLTSEQVNELVATMAQGKEAQARIDADGDALSSTERTQLEKSTQDGKEARKTLIQSNVPLLVNWARKRTASGVPLLDLVNEGYEGLEKAVDDFDPSQGKKFSTYATPKIKQAIQRGIYNIGSVIRQPVHIQEPIDRFTLARKKLELEFGPDVTDEKICEVIGWTPKMYDEMKRALVIRDNRSLEKPMNEHDGGEEVELVDFIEDDSIESVESQTEKLVLLSEVQKALEMLGDEERAVFTKYHGLDGVEEMTYEAIGKELGLTRERVRQIEGRVIAKIRHPLFGKQFQHLRDFIE